MKKMIVEETKSSCGQVSTLYYMKEFDPQYNNGVYWLGETQFTGWLVEETWEPGYEKKVEINPDAPLGLIKVLDSYIKLPPQVKEIIKGIDPLPSL